MAEAYLINPVRRHKKRRIERKKRRHDTENKSFRKISRRKAARKLHKSVHKARPQGPKKGAKIMARRKRRKLHGAALAAHLKKVGKRRNPHKARRKRHSVKRHHRKGATVKRHMSNPLRRRSHRRSRRTHRNPMAGLGSVGSSTMSGLIAAGVLFGTLFAVGMANKQAEKLPYANSSQWANLAAKLAVALGGLYLVNMAGRKGWLTGTNKAVASAAVFAPLGLSLLNQLAPSIANQISLADEDDMGAELGMEAGNRVSDYTIDAELGAELGKQETESSAY